MNNRSYFQSRSMKEANANKAKLSGLAREIYLLGIAGLNKARDVAEKGNNGEGYRLFAKPKKASAAASKS